MSIRVSVDRLPLRGCYVKGNGYNELFEYARGRCVRQKIPVFFVNDK